MTKTALRLTILALSLVALAGSVAAEQVDRTQSNDEQAPLRSWAITFPTQTEPQDLAAETDPQAISLLLPAVQAAREAARR